MSNRAPARKRRSLLANEQVAEQVQRFAPATISLVAVGLMLGIHLIGANDVREAGRVMWRPILAITSIMITTASAHALGVLDRVAAGLFPRARGSTSRLFFLAFFLSAATAAVLNNDSAVLLLMPIVIALIRALYPEHPQIVVPFAFVVFSAAGVAPMMMSNPMNLIVAEYAGIPFNTYSAHMIPVAVAGWIVAFIALRLVLHPHLRTAPRTEAVASPPARWRKAEVHGLMLLLAVLGAYPVVSYIDGPVWVVAAVGAVIGLALCVRHGAGSPARIIKAGVAWEILIFLVGVSTAAIGLRNAGVVQWLADLYETNGSNAVGIASAIGSALINNHPMSLVNILAIEQSSGTGRPEVFAALIGGDLGPRLLPWGSLAGLLWYSMLRRFDIYISFVRFVLVGLVLTVPSLAVSLFIHSLLS